MAMKQFNLEEYLANPSRKIVTGDGKNVIIHCTNFRGIFPIIAEIESVGKSFSYNEDGKTSYVESSIYDLFFAPEKHEGWVNIFPNNIIGGIYESEEEAKKAAFWSSCPFTTIKIEWEEEL